MWDGDIAALQGQYLFLLAHVCHVTPEQLPDMSVVHFARLLDGIDDWLAAQRQGAG